MNKNQLKQYLLTKRDLTGRGVRCSYSGKTRTMYIHYFGIAADMLNYKFDFKIEFQE